MSKVTQVECNGVTYELGNVVRLRSGGPSMTVMDFRDDDGVPLALCSWYDNRVLDNALEMSADDDLPYAGYFIEEFTLAGLELVSPATVRNSAASESMQ